MDIDLNYLKFHSFKLNKSLHNLTIKDNKKYFERIFYHDENSLVSTLKAIRKLKSTEDLRKEFSHFHIIKNEKRNLVETIIDKCHKNLKNDLLQLFENMKKINYYQLKISNEQRLILVIRKKSNKLDYFIPILFDLNHLVYRSKEINYDKNLNQKKYEWNFKKEQEDIKEKLLKQIKK